MNYFHRFKITGPALHRSWAPYVRFYTVIQVYCTTTNTWLYIGFLIFFIFKYVQTFLRLGGLNELVLKKNVSNKPII